MGRTGCQEHRKAESRTSAITLKRVRFSFCIDPLLVRFQGQSGILSAYKLSVGVIHVARSASQNEVERQGKSHRY